jgi:hypothetical protein
LKIPVACSQAAATEKAAAAPWDVATREALVFNLEETMNRKQLIKAMLGIAALALFACGTRADSDTLDFTLSPASQTVVDGTLVVVFNGTISNPSATDTIWLNGDDTSTNSGLVTVNDLGLINVPLFLDPGQSSGLITDVFEVDLDPTLTPGAYTGTFSILGGADGGSYTDFADLVDTNFSVTVTPETVSTAPEPGALLLLATGLVGTLMLKKRFRSLNSQ